MNENEEVSTSFNWATWLETQSPLWVIYALVIVAMIMMGRIALKWLPIMCEKHCQMLDQATASMLESAESFRAVGHRIDGNREVLQDGQDAVSDASKPFCRALYLMAPESVKSDVDRELKEVQHLLAVGRAKDRTQT